jgi:serine/threonine protein kinase
VQVFVAFTRHLFAMQPLQLDDQQLFRGQMPLKYPKVDLWEGARFKNVGVVRAVPGEHIQVYLMLDTHSGEHVTVKRMLKCWAGTCHAEFVAMHPNTVESPWQDFGCVDYLHGKEYESALALQGIYKSERCIYAVFDAAVHGNLRTWRSGFWFNGMSPTVEDVLCQIVIQVCASLRNLHDLGVVHGNVSTESIMLQSHVTGQKNELSESSPFHLDVKLSCFGRVSMQRWVDTQFQDGRQPKYIAPELHSSQGKVDGFLVDNFALGVTLFALITQSFPWRSTAANECEQFDAFQHQGTEALASLPRYNPIMASMSDGLHKLLDGLLDPSPDHRLTLGESIYGSQRKSVWNEPWILAHLNDVTKVAKETEPPAKS